MSFNINVDVYGITNIIKNPTVLQLLLIGW